MFDSLYQYGLVATMFFRDSLSGFAAVSDEPCKGGVFFGLPPWYKYLGSDTTGTECVPVFSSLSDVWLIVLAIIEILLRLAAIAAIIYLVYGGIRLTTSRGSPDKIASARTGIIDALVGLLIAVIAVALVNFIGRSV